MSGITYFQRFSQRENHATNNTLLLLRYFYQSSPFKLQNVLASLLETELSIGLKFQQQVRGEASIPDAQISQEPMRIVIETKRHGELDGDQISRHFKSINGVDRKDNPILIGLTKEPIADATRRALTAEGAQQGVTFAALTFSQIADALLAQCTVADYELRSMVEDYKNYIEGEN